MKTVNAYRFEELSETAQNLAIDTVTFALDSFGYDCKHIGDDFIERYKDEGVIISDFYYTGMYDGDNAAAFEGYLDPDLLLRVLGIDDSEYEYHISVGVRYNAVTYMSDFRMVMVDDDRWYKQEHLKAMREYCLDIAKEFMRAIRKDYEYMMSRDSVVEYIELNDFYFFVNGDIASHVYFGE